MEIQRVKTFFATPNPVKTDLSKSMHLRFESLSKLSFEIAQADSFDDAFECLSLNLKYLMEAFGFLFYYQRDEVSKTYLSFPRTKECITDAKDPHLKLAHTLLELDRPALFRVDEPNSISFEGTQFQHPRIKAILSYPMDLGQNGKALLIVSNKNTSKYFQFDYKFSRLLINTVCNKLDQIQARQALLGMVQEKEELLQSLKNERNVIETQKREQAIVVAVAESERKRADELKTLNEELDRFVYIASHDLRAPLTSILGLIGILSETESSVQDQEAYLGLIQKSVNKLDLFIQNIVDYSRNSRMDVKFAEVSLEEESKSIMDGLSYLQGTQQIKFEIDIQQETPFISDGTRVKIILNNFLSNAVKYHDLSKESPFVHLKAAVTEREAVISVVDNGKGIAEEFHSKLFDMFFRASVDQTGSGIGLYIVQEMANRLGAQISFVSEPGEGSTFTIHIPNAYSSK